MGKRAVRRAVMAAVVDGSAETLWHGLPDVHAPFIIAGEAVRLIDWHPFDPVLPVP
jgi:hypothetical protein